MVFESISGEGKSYQDVIHFIVCRSQVQIFYWTWQRMPPVSAADSYASVVIKPCNDT